jgi:predicted lipid-binding transport protein (Tim44 family)
MKRWHWLAVICLSLWVALAPGLAEARAGGGSSQGSRGSRTYQDNSARPMERSITPQPSPSQPQYSPRPSAPAPGFQPGFAQRHPFLSGLAGGFIGAGLAGMLFGHSAWAADGSPMGSMFGLLLQIAIIGGLIWLAIRLFRSRSAVPAGGMARDGGDGYPRSVGAMAAPAARREPVDIPITEADYNEWSQLLAGIQDAWSRGDLGALRRYVTPEMLSYFSEQLSATASRGVQNKVEDVELLKGDVEEAWAEDGLEYVTARLRWKARDYTVRLDNGQVVEGDPSRPVEASELWTFVRSRNGGRWLLSAIQQT